MCKNNQLLDIISAITRIGEKYFTDNETLSRIAELKQIDRMDLTRVIRSRRRSSEGGFAIVYKLVDANLTTHAVIHEVTDKDGKVIHEHYESVLLESGQMIHLID
jgi:hypothetical protein